MLDAGFVGRGNLKQQRLVERTSHELGGGPLIALADPPAR
jgi:hypothetical protein